MCDVKRVRNIAQKLARLYRFPVFYFATRTNGNDQGKKNDNGKCLIQSIHPKMRAASDPWNRKNDNNHQAAKPKSPIDSNQFTHTAKQYARKKRKQQTGKTYIELLLIERPSAN